jgi:hypothetical protein
MDRYTELSDPVAILKSLEAFFPGLGGFTTADVRSVLEAQGCAPFCRIVSVRRKYGGTGGGISVDLDIISEPSSINYNIGEVEVSVSEAVFDASESDVLILNLCRVRLLHESSPGVSRVSPICSAD